MTAALSLASGRLPGATSSTAAAEVDDEDSDADDLTLRSPLVCMYVDVYVSAVSARIFISRSNLEPCSTLTVGMKDNNKSNMKMSGVHARRKDHPFYMRTRTERLEK
jgi:hypothetical protein